MSKYSVKTVHPHVMPNLDEWPVYKLSEDRRQFVQDLDENTLEDLMENSTDQLSDIITETVYLERIRIKEEPWKVDPPKEKQFWNRIRKKLVKYTLDQPKEIAAKNNEEILNQIIHRYSEEIVGTFKISTFLFARRFLTFFFNRLFQAKQRGFFRLGGARRRLYEKINVHGEIEKLRELFQKGTVVVVPTHHSNLDSIMIGYALDAVVGIPSFSYGAGLNLYNAGSAAYFMNRIGAYRVDRRKKNPVYLRTLKINSRLLIERGINSIFFPGGTRSRSGALEDKLKLGLLNTTIEAQRNLLLKGEERKVFIIPLILSYPFVLEAAPLVKQYLKKSGKERFIDNKDTTPKPFKILQFIWKILAEGTNITLSVGQPMDVLGNKVDSNGDSFDQFGKKIDIKDYFMLNGQVTKDKQRESVYTIELGTSIVERYHKDNIVLSSHLVAFAAFNMLKKENQKLDLYGVLRLPSEDYHFEYENLKLVVDQLLSHLRQMESEGNIKLSSILLKGDPDQIIKDGVQHLGAFHVNKPLRFDKQKQVISDSFQLLYFYHNRLLNYDLDKVIKIKMPKVLATTVEI
ncbi:MAG: 1-acyl-sn-glycerol-3-phosphate acyltransferase [Bacteroidota bacterium]